MMNQNNSDTDGKKSHSHGGHMWMMAICCGLPIAGFLTIAILGINLPSLETILLLFCPIGMIGMMYMMHRDSKGKEKEHSCCQSENSAEASVSDIARDEPEKVEPGLNKPQHVGSLEA